MKINYVPEGTVVRAAKVETGSVETAAFTKGASVKVKGEDGKWHKATVVSVNGNNLNIVYTEDKAKERVNTKENDIKSAGGKATEETKKAPKGKKGGLDEDPITEEEERESERTNRMLKQKSKRTAQRRAEERDGPTPKHRPATVKRKGTDGKYRAKETHRPTHRPATVKRKGGDFDDGRRRPEDDAPAPTGKKHRPAPPRKNMFDK